MTSAKRRVLLYSIGAALMGTALYLGYGYEPAPDPAVRLNGAAMIGGLGQYDEAIAICDQVLDEHPDNLEARIFKATFLSGADRHEAALEAYDDALEHVGDDKEMRRNLIQDRAGVLLTLGRMDEFRAARQTLAAAGVGHRVHVLDGLAATKAGELEAAIRAYSLGLEDKPDEEHIKARLWHVLVQHGDAAVAEREFEVARRSYDRACGLFERAYKAHLKSAEVRLAQSEPDAALTVLGTVDPGTPGLAPLAFRAATAFLEAGEEADAVRALAFAAEADADAVKALLDKSAAWSELRKDSRVAAIFEPKEASAETAAPSDGADVEAETVSGRDGAE